MISQNYEDDLLAMHWLVGISERRAADRVASRNTGSTPCDDCSSFDFSCTGKCKEPITGATKMPIKCTYCGGADFLEGPSGGMSTNILCANPDCRRWFNLMFDKLEDLHRVEPSDAEKAAANKAREARGPVFNLGAQGGEVTLESIYQEGGQMFREGKLAHACLKQKPYGGYAAPYSDLVRMSGWFDAATANAKAREATPANLASHNWIKGKDEVQSGTVTGRITHDTWPHEEVERNYEHGKLYRYDATSQTFDPAISGSELREAHRSEQSDRGE